MKQVLQSLRTGEIELVDAPAPSVRPRHVLIESRRTLISAGTERMLLDFGRGNLVQKALQQPDKVQHTFQRVRTDGLSATIEAVRSKLDQARLRPFAKMKFLRSVAGQSEQRTRLRPMMEHSVYG